MGKLEACLGFFPENLVLFSVILGFLLANLALFPRE